MFRCMEGQENDTLVRVRIIWWLLGTFTVQLMGRPGHIPGRRDVVHEHGEVGLPDTMLMYLLWMFLSSSPLEWRMYVHPHAQGEAP